MWLLVQGSRQGLVYKKDVTRHLATHTSHSFTFIFVRLVRLSTSPSTTPVVGSRIKGFFTFSISCILPLSLALTQIYSYNFVIAILRW